MKDWNKVAQGLAISHCVVAALGFYHFQSFESRPLPLSTLVFGVFYPLPPLLAAWIGVRLTRGTRSRGLLAFGMCIAVAATALAYLVTISADASEPLAPLLLVFTAIWQAAGLALLLPAVWLVGRREAKMAATDR